jgi:hypothetical protein
MEGLQTMVRSEIIVYQNRPGREKFYLHPGRKQLILRKKAFFSQKILFSLRESHSPAERALYWHKKVLRRRKGSPPTEKTLNRREGLQTA